MAQFMLASGIRSISDALTRRAGEGTVAVDMSEVRKMGVEGHPLMVCLGYSVVTLTPPL